MVVRRMGRPKVKDPRVPYMTIRLTPEERREIEEAAAPYPPATWARVTLLEAARQTKGRPTGKGGGK